MVSSGWSRWHGVALAGVLALTVFVHFFRLEQEGFANLYYSAAVQSMLTSPANFFFVAFDAAGYVSVDKPPLGLWVQALSALVLGFSGWAVLMPQALAGVLAVLVLFHLVARTFGPTAGLLAALVLALTPISVAANRNNTMDSQLVLTSLLAAWAVLKAAETGHLRWLLAGAVLVGVGFNIKMLQAFLVVPALVGVYVLAAPLTWWRRVAHLGLAGVLAAVVSLSWAVVVDLTPATARPYVGSSQNNTVLELMVGHNGATRLGALAQLFGGQGQPGVGAPGGAPPGGTFPGGAGPGNGLPGNLPPGALPPGNLPPRPPQGGNLPQPPAGAPPGLANETGTAGVGRLFNAQLGGQASWFIPLGLGLAAVLWVAGPRRGWPLDRAQVNVLFWVAWLVPQAVFFSFAGLFHRYYLVMLAPASAALVGAGLVAAWSLARQGGWRAWLWPLALVVGLVTALSIVLTEGSWAGWLAPLLLVMGAVAVWAALWPRWSWLGRGLGVVALLLAPALWSLTPLWGSDAALPFAGPALLQPNAMRRTGQVSTDAGLINHLQTHRTTETYLLATLNAGTAAPIMLATGEPVMALGGFSGGDPILTADQLAAKVAAGEVRFFLFNGARGRPNNGSTGDNALVQWVTAQCTPVTQWAGLYDCAP